MAEYGFDLVEEWETVGCRRLWVLVQGLPMTAAVWRKENEWTRQDEFAAALLEMTDICSRRVVMALGGKLGGEALHIDRPDAVVEAQESKEKKMTTDTQEIARWFALHGG